MAQYQQISLGTRTTDGTSIALLKGNLVGSVVWTFGTWTGSLQIECALADTGPWTAIGSALTANGAVALGEIGDSAEYVRFTITGMGSPELVGCFVRGYDLRTM